MPVEALLTSRSPKIKKLLKQTFGFDTLRPGQAEVIDAALAGENLLAVMPTGGGKSLCFQLPALALPGTTIVISPLIALMKDQKSKLDQLEIETLELNSFLTSSQQQDNILAAKLGTTEFLYVTPEKFANPEFLNSIKSLKIDLVVIDEAHCMSQWGHDFRPSYLQISDGWKALGKPQILAFTATATDAVIEDIKSILHLPDLNVLTQGIFRKNLFYEAHVLDNESEKLAKIKEYLATLPGPGIIYSATVKAAEELYDILLAEGHNVFKYHAKMSNKERPEQRVAFMESSDGIMIATNAFGMGIDKADIRYIIHLHFPGSLEAYYQESGRAGRDGELAKCILLYLKKDKATQSFFNAGKYPKLDDLKMVYQVLQVQQAQHGHLDLELLKKTEGVPKTKAATLVAMLKKKKVITGTVKRWTLAKTQLTEPQLTTILETYEEKRVSDGDKLKEMVRYAQTALCRWQFILKYFGENETPLCHHCDNCQRGTAQMSETTIN